MDQRERQAAAELLLSDRLLNEIMANMEASALNLALSGLRNGDDIQRQGLSQIEALRSLRGELQRIADAPTTPVSKGGKA